MAMGLASTFEAIAEVVEMGGVKSSPGVEQAVKVEGCVLAKDMSKDEEVDYPPLKADPHSLAPSAFQTRQPLQIPVVFGGKQQTGDALLTPPKHVKPKPKPLKLKPHKKLVPIMPAKKVVYPTGQEPPTKNVELARILKSLEKLKPTYPKPTKKKFHPTRQQLSIVDTEIDRLMAKLLHRFEFNPAPSSRPSSHEEYEEVVCDEDVNMSNVP